MTQTENALVIGANGTIAKAVILELLEKETITTVYGISRSSSDFEHAKYSHIVCSAHEEQAMGKALEAIPDSSLTQIVCCIGQLHDERKNVFPEKKFEDINAKQLEYYFSVNTILPALWLTAVEPKINRQSQSYFTFLSARVGSIGDNRLGGWYGYRASKAALNSLIKTAQIELRRRKPNCSLVLYHPGTVDTSLSEPFQKNVPDGKLFTPTFTASQLISLLPNLSADSAPHFVDWQGNTIPW